MLRYLLSTCMFFSMTYMAHAENLAERLGYPPESKLLIIPADDVGMCHAANVATIEAFRHAMILSCSVSVPCSWFSEIAAYAREHLEAVLGLPLTLTSAWNE